MHGFSIGWLAKRAAVSTDTIRFYEKAGLLSPRVRRPSGFREYSELDLKQLRFIRCGRLLGFSLGEIAELLALTGGSASAARTLIQQKVLLIDRKIEEFRRWRSCLIEFMECEAESMPARQSILDCFTETPPGAHAETVVPHPPQESLRDDHD